MTTSNETIRTLSVNLIIWLAAQVGNTQEKQIALQRLLGIYEEKKKNEGDRGTISLDAEEGLWDQRE